MRKKRIISLIMIMTMSLSMVLASVGCTSKQTANGDDEKITLTVTISEKEFGDDQIFDRYMEEHPNIIINEVPVSNNDSKLISMISSGNNAPDLIRVQGFDELQVFVERGLMMPLDDYVNKSEAINQDDLYEIAELFRYDGKTRGEGSLYGLPKDWSPIGVWCNVKAFKECGLEIPSTTEQMTWSEFAELAEKLTKWDGTAIERHGVVTALALPTLMEMQLNTYGLSLWDEQYKETTLFEKKTRECMEYWMNLHEKGALASALYPAADTIGQSALVEDQVGMVLAGYWFRGAFSMYNKLDAASEELIFVPMPSDEKECSYAMDVTGLGIFAGTKHPEEAYELWEYLMCSDEVVSTRAKIGFGIPAFKSYYNQLPNESEFDQQLLKTVDTQIERLDISPRTNPYISYSSLIALFDKYYVPVLFEKSTLDDALTTINKEATLLSQEGKELLGVK